MRSTELKADDRFFLKMYPAKRLTTAESFEDGRQEIFGENCRIETGTFGVLPKFVFLQCTTFTNFAKVKGASSMAEKIKAVTFFKRNTYRNLFPQIPTFAETD